jgi:hypothetical protein
MSEEKCEKRLKDFPTPAVKKSDAENCHINWQNFPLIVIDFAFQVHRSEKN